MHAGFIFQWKIPLIFLAIKRSVPPRKSCQLYQNSMPKCWGRSTEHVCNSSSKNIAYFARYWGLKYLGLWHHLRCAFYSTVLVLRQTIYGGRLLLVIALVLASCWSTVFISPNVKKMSLEISPANAIVQRQWSNGREVSATGKPIIEPTDNPPTKRLF